MTGTSVILSFRAAASRAWPAMIVPSAATRIGFVQPNSDDAGGHLRHLLVAVRAGVSDVGQQPIDCPDLDNQAREIDHDAFRLGP